MSVENVHDYPAPVWRRFRQPAHAGRFADEAGVIRAEAGSPAARSVLRLELKLEGGRVAEARFMAYGCPTAIAVGDWLAERLLDSAAADWAGIDAERIRGALEIPDDRVHCALMGEDVLRQLAKQIRS